MSFLRQFFKTVGRSIAATGTLFFLFSGQAHAVDGCKVLLCVAGNWKNISQCRPDVEQAMRDIAKGKGWPTCDSAGTSNGILQPTSQATCPAMYSNIGWTGGDGGTYGYVSCQYDYVINLKVGGQAWSDLFLNSELIAASKNSDRATSTRYYPVAKAALGTNIDPTYDNDAGSYVPPPATPAPSCTSDNC